MEKGNVLMVCLGNICRSPLAQGIFEQLSKEFSIAVDSAGTAGYHIGSPPDPRSIKSALNHGIDISKQKARQFTRLDFDSFDHIFVMDLQNLKNVLELSQTEKERGKVKLLLTNEEVEDPYYGDNQGFEIVYSKIEKACKEIIDSWKQ
ncbi:MAG: low molecular weight phosphotyrosine protein phosphatase [Flavobacteriaceae bacterium]|nr:low molecular weight phosphotyrosine protein phosphatase [Flavobacteriaceae bacterium]